MATLAELQSDLTAYLAARDKILSGAQSMTVGKDTFTFATFARLEEKIEQLRSDIEVKQRGGMRTFVPRAGRL